MNWDYVAGFIDGEGSIIIKPPRVRLYISNTNKNILVEIKNFVGAGTVSEVKRKLKPNWNRQYSWTLCDHKEVLRILKQLENRIILKKHLGDEAIKYIENKRWIGFYLSREELEKVKNLPSRKAAKELGVSAFSILKYSKESNIKKIKGGSGFIYLERN